MPQVVKHAKEEDQIESPKGLRVQFIDAGTKRLRGRAESGAADVKFANHRRVGFDSYYFRRTTALGFERKNPSAWPISSTRNPLMSCGRPKNGSFSVLGLLQPGVTIPPGNSIDRNQYSSDSICRFIQLVKGSLLFHHWRFGIAHNPSIAIWLPPHAQKVFHLKRLRTVAAKLYTL